MKLFVTIFLAVLLAGGALYGLHSHRVEKEQKRQLVERTNAEAEDSIKKLEVDFVLLKSNPFGIKPEEKRLALKDAELARKWGALPEISPELKGRAIKLAEEIESKCR